LHSAFMVASRKRRTEEHKLLIASLRCRRDFVKAYSKASPSASNLFWAGGGIVMFPASERTERSLCKTFQARARLCFDASSSSSKSWIAFGVIGMEGSVHKNTKVVKTAKSSFEGVVIRSAKYCLGTPVSSSSITLLRRDILHQKSYSQ
jgi:hypothetical protein